MKILLLIIGCSAGPSNLWASCQNHDGALTAIAAKPKNKWFNLDWLKPQLSPLDSFKFNFRCLDLSYRECAMAKNAMVRAGVRIAAILKFREPVIVSVEIKPHCDPSEDEICRIRLGDSKTGCFYGKLKINSRR